MYVHLYFSANLKAAVVQKIEGGNLSWARMPKFNYTNTDLEGRNRDISFKFEASEKGVITFAEIEESSGLKDLDQMLLEKFKKARVKPYRQNGVIYPIRSTQKFRIMLNNFSPFEETIEK